MIRHADLLPEDQWEVVESPDGDPAKRGTITAVSPITRGDAIPRQPDPNTTDQDRLVVAERNTDLIVAGDLDASLAALYDSDRATRDAVDALRDADADRKRPR